MYIDPRTEFRYENDEFQARWTIYALIVSSTVFSVWIIELLKHTPGLG
jgi:hypothetical protein